jgi:hypothetical protein
MDIAKVLARRLPPVVAAARDRSRGRQSSRAVAQGAERWRPSLESRGMEGSPRGVSAVYLPGDVTRGVAARLDTTRSTSASVQSSIAGVIPVPGALPYHARSRTPWASALIPSGRGQACSWGGVSYGGPPEPPMPSPGISRLRRTIHVCGSARMLHTSQPSCGPQKYRSSRHATSSSSRYS